MFRVSQTSTRKWLEGESFPDTKRFADMSSKLGVCGEWLLTGKGPMHPGDQHEAAAGDKPHGGDAITWEERVLLEKYRALSQADRTRLQAIVTALDAVGGELKKVKGG